MINKKMFPKILLSTLFLALPAYAAVTVDINTHRYQFDVNPRLDEVLAPVALQTSWYWPAATLYRLDSDEPEQLRQQLLQQLVQLKQLNGDDTKLVATLQSLEQQLRSWQLAKRILQPINFDFARIRPQFNPRFDDGAYLLQLKHRPVSVYIFGAVKSAVVTTHRSATPAARYLLSAQPTESADLSELVLVQPDGTVQTAGAAYWNRSTTEAMPGAQLFIPLQSQLFNSQFELLNKRLLELSIHRVLP